jgi:hypothetical protein
MVFNVFEVLGSFCCLICIDIFWSSGDWSFFKDVEGIYIRILSFLWLCHLVKHMQTAGCLHMLLSSVIDEVDSTLMETAGSSEMLVHIYQIVVLHSIEQLHS